MISLIERAFEDHNALRGPVDAPLRWRDDQEPPAVAHLQRMPAEQQSLTRRAVTSSAIATIISLLALAFSSFNFVYRR